MEEQLENYTSIVSNTFIPVCTLENKLFFSKKIDTQSRPKVGFIELYPTEKSSAVKIKRSL